MVNIKKCKTRKKEEKLTNRLQKMFRLSIIALLNINCPTMQEGKKKEYGIYFIKMYENIALSEGMKG